MTVGVGDKCWTVIVGVARVCVHLMFSCVDKIFKLSSCIYPKVYDRLVNFEGYCDYELLLGIF